MDVQPKDEGTIMIMSMAEAGGAEGVAETVAKSTSKSKSKGREQDSALPVKRRCVSTACIACRRRKSKCDGNTPSCAACSSVYGTECIYDPNSDHRRKGVYKKDIDNLKTRNSTLQTLIQAILNYPEDEVPDLVRQIRTCESLDDVAESILNGEKGLDEEEEDRSLPFRNALSPEVATFEGELSGKMGELRLDNGSVRFIGGTSNLIFLGADTDGDNGTSGDDEAYEQQEHPITSWTTVESDPTVILHLMDMYFTWHYSYFTTLSKSLFYRDFLLGQQPEDAHRKAEYCTPLLVNAMLALGCHFTSLPAALARPNDPASAGDHFFLEAKRLLLDKDEHETPKLTSVQALALMSVREAGCGREARGWVYSGMSFRMACDLGLNLDSGGLVANTQSNLDEQDIDARRITFWGCYVFDKCWSNYLGRVPQLSSSNSTVPKFDVFPVEESDIWSPYTDTGAVKANSQPARTRAVFLQLSLLCEISSDLLSFFYHPTALDRPMGKQAELKKLGELHTRLEAWRKTLPKEMEPKEGQLPNVLVMHMFFHLLFIHLFRPFLKYSQNTSPLPPHVSPRKICTHAAATISKLLRLYKRTYGLRQIVNVAVYIAHAACTIHLLNLPEKNAKRDIIYGVKHLEEIAEGWLVARRTLNILAVLARRWKIELPEEAAAVLSRVDTKSGVLEARNGRESSDSPRKNNSVIPRVPPNPSPPLVSSPPMQQKPQASFGVQSNSYYNSPASTTDTFNSTRTHASGLTQHSPTELQAIYLEQQQQQQQQQQNQQQHHHTYASNNPTTTSTRPQMPHSQQNTLSDPQVFAQTNSPSPPYTFAGMQAQGIMGDGQDWWTRDQAEAFALFDHWSGLDGGGLGASNLDGGVSVNDGGLLATAGVGNCMPDQVVVAGENGFSPPDSYEQSGAGWA